MRVCTILSNVAVITNDGAWTFSPTHKEVWNQMVMMPCAYENICAISKNGQHGIGTIHPHTCLAPFCDTRCIQTYSFCYNSLWE